VADFVNLQSWYRHDSQATKTFATIKHMLHEALAKVKPVIKGALKIIAALTYRQRYQRSIGRDPLRCPHCHSDMGVWRIWHPTYGVIHDELEAMRRGKYASQAPRADPVGSLIHTAGNFASFLRDIHPKPVMFRYYSQG